VKILHVTYGYWPDPVGGTEQYVAALSRELRHLGVESIVAAPGPADDRYEHDGIQVRRFRHLADGASLEALYGDGDVRAAEAFDEILNDEAPDLVHQHAWSPACSIALVQRAKARGIPVVFTYHTPAVSCPRGTLLRRGTEPCDGRLDAHECAACTLQGLGLGRVTSGILARTPASLAEVIARAGAAGGPWTALRMRALIARRHAAIARLFTDADRIVALSPWVERLLELARVPRSRVSVSAHGTAVSAVRPAASRERSDAPLRIAHLGRLHPAKGTEILIRALADAPRLDVTLDVFAIVQPGDEEHARAIGRLASADPRVRVRTPLAHEDVVDRLSEYDLVAVPSQGLETGPLVVLEAFAAGVPVVGSALGGIADKIRDGINGVLVQPHDSIAAWRDALVRCDADRGWIASLRTRVPPPRTMAAVAGEMRSLYLGQLLHLRQGDGGQGFPA